MRLPSLSVLLVQHGRTELTLRAVGALNRSTYSGPLEILIHDNATPGGVGAVEGLPSTRVFRSQENLGFGPATNRLAAEASSDLLLLLNNDTLVAPSCLERLARRLLASESTGAVSPQFRWFDGRVLEMGVFVGEIGEGWQLFRDAVPPRCFLTMSFRADYGSGAGLLLRRDTFARHQGFDDAFSPAYYEDTDLCLRMARTGLRTLVEPTAVVYHIDGGTAGDDDDPSSTKSRLARSSRGRFVHRWAPTLAARGPATFPAALRHALTDDESQPLALWVLPDLLRPDRSGGDARTAREIAAVRAGGFAVATWSERLGDWQKYGADLESAGIFWFGPDEARRWISPRPRPCLHSLRSLLELDIFDLVVASVAELAERVGPMVRSVAPRARFVVDTSVLHYRQYRRSLEVGLAPNPDLHAEKSWELAIYKAADAVITASRTEALELTTELPGIEVMTFDVGAYEPRSECGNARQGAVVFLGNFAHPPNVDAVGWWLDDIAPRVEELAGSPIPLRVIGHASDILLDRFGPSRFLDVVGWVENLDDELAEARAFAAPLRYGAGTKDKISIALSYGLPTITTASGAEDMPVPLREALLLAGDALGFAKLVVRLMRDEAFWSEQAQFSRRAAMLAWQEQQLTNAGLASWLVDLLARGGFRSRVSPAR